MIFILIDGLSGTKVSVVWMAWLELVIFVEVEVTLIITQEDRKSCHCLLDSSDLACLPAWHSSSSFLFIKYSLSSALARLYGNCLDIALFD